jgi:Mrp family chromosome partitioning ATPase/predicted Fe-Mo cluster-binding NifX family protein
MEQQHSCGHGGPSDEHQKQDTEIAQALGLIKNKILVMSGKGGVGKSSVAAYLAVALAKRGYKVGLMDVDLHGPSIPRLLGLHGTIQSGSRQGKARPVSHLPNLEVISIESLMGPDKDLATIWRGPLKIGVIRQFISDIEWEDLDYMIIDSPPGTGDEPLTVAQTIPDASAIIVTTPQEISLADVRKSINFCRNVNMSILGLVENMSGMACPHCGKTIELFKTKGGMVTAKKENVKLLGTLPIEPQIVQMGDSGSVAVLEDEQLAFTKAFEDFVDSVIQSQDQKKPATPAPEERPAPKAEKRDGGTIVVVPVAEGKLASHFGHCEQFAFVETQNGEIKGTELRTPPPHEPGVLPQWLHQQGADVIIAGGMGSRAKELLNQNGIDVVVGAPTDTPESLARQYLSGSLVTGENVCDH